MTLTEIKKQTVNHYAAWWTIIGIDPIAFRLLWLLQRVVPKINPNVITWLSLLTGVLAAWYFATGHYFVGGAIYQLAFLLDCIDGKIARLRGISSMFGVFFDGFVNNIVYCLALIGLAASGLDDPVLVIVCMTSLLLHVLALDVSNSLEKYGKQHDWNYVGSDLSLISRLRRSVPGMWPDRHLFVLWIFPSMGYLTFGLIANTVIDLMLLTYRVYLIYKTSAQEH